MSDWYSYDLGSRRHEDKSVFQPNDVRSIDARDRDQLASRVNPVLITVVVTGVLFSMLLRPALAATQVRGELDDLQITAQNASIREILEALSAKFKLAYKLPPGIDGNLTGSYSGTLRRTLARILDGNDYFVEVSDGGIKVVVLGASRTTANQTASQPVAVNENTLAALAPSKSAPDPTPASSKSPPPPLANYLATNGPAPAGQ